MRNHLIGLLLLGIFVQGAKVMAEEANYDESKMPAYTLPDPLVLANGQKVTTPEQWRAERRPELLRLFEEQVFGRAPERPADLWFRVWDLLLETLRCVFHALVSVLFPFGCNFKLHRLFGFTTNSVYSNSPEGTDSHTIREISRKVWRVKYPVASLGPLNRLK